MIVHEGSMNTRHLGVLLLIAGLAGCTREDDETARRKLKNAGQELKRDLHQAGQEIKRDAHEASREIKKGTQKLKEDVRSK